MGEQTISSIIGKSKSSIQYDAPGENDDDIFVVARMENYKPSGLPRSPTKRSNRSRYVLLSPQKSPTGRSHRSSSSEDTYKRSPQRRMKPPSGSNSSNRHHSSSRRRRSRSTEHDRSRRPPSGRSSSRKRSSHRRRSNPSRSRSPKNDDQHKSSRSSTRSHSDERHRESSRRRSDSSRDRKTTSESRSSRSGTSNRQRRSRSRSTSRSRRDRRSRSRGKPKSRQDRGSRSVSKSRRHYVRRSDRSNSRSRKESSGKQHSPSRTGSSCRNERSYTNSRPKHSLKDTPDNVGSKSRNRPSSMSQARLRLDLAPPLHSVSSSESSGLFDHPEMEPPCRPLGEMNAVLLIQSVYRGHRASIERAKLVQQKAEEALERYKREKCQVKEDQLKRMRARLVEIEQQTKADLRSIKDAFKAEKKVLKERARQKLQQHAEKQEANREAEQAAMESLDRLEIVQLEEEAKVLKGNKKDLESNTGTLEEDNKKLVQINNDIAQLFQSLNEFARKKVDGKKKLVAAQQKLSKVYKPKIKADLTKGALAWAAEIKLVKLYRGHVYKIAQGVQASDIYDKLLFDNIMRTIGKCESSLGKEMMDLEQSLNYIDFDASGECDASIVVMEKSESSQAWDTSQNWQSINDLNESHAWNVSRRDWDASDIWDGSGKLESNASKQFDGNPGGASHNWMSGDEWASEGIWATTVKLGNLEKKLQLADIDCQSHDSWRTEHESLMLWMD